MPTITLRIEEGKLIDFQNKLKFLRKGITEGAIKEMPRLAKLIERRSKQIAPVGSTGFLRSELHAFAERGKPEINISWGQAFYGSAQEFGFDAHRIPRAYFQQHSKNPGRKGEKVSIADTGGFVTVRNNTPHVIPAIEKTRKEFADIGPKVLKNHFE